MNLENIMFSEMSEKDKYCMMSFICGILKIIQNECIGEIEKDFRCRKQMCSYQRREGSRECGINIYKLIYVK